MAGIFSYQNHLNIFDASKISNCLIQHAQQDFQHPVNIISLDSEKTGLGFAMPYGDKSWPLESENGNYYLQLFGQIILPNGSKLSAKNFQKDFLNYVSFQQTIKLGLIALFL